MDLRALFKRRQPEAIAARVPSVPNGARIYAIGDVHGRADLLAEMADLIATDLRRSPTPAAASVFLGDYIDRGPNAKGVLDRLAASDFPTPLVTLVGNHETMLLEALEHPEAIEQWRHNGGLETLRSYGVKLDRPPTSAAYAKAASEILEAMPKRHLDFLRRCRFSFEAGDYFFCHAGVRPGIALSRQSESDLLWIRHDFLSSDKDFGRIIVHGHTPVPAPEIKPNRINIDTGAYISGKLTCLILEGESRRFLHTGDSRRRT